MSESRSQILFEITVGFILAMVSLILILFFRDAPVRVITVAGLITAIALLVAGWLLINDEDEEDDWTSEWRF